jgi:thioredoxin 1
MEVTLTQENFEAEVLKSPVPVLVDFWAEWCGPCKLQNPILEEITKELAGKVKIAKVDVDKYPDLASDYNVMSIPTLKFFNKGQVVSEMIGLQSKDKLLSEIQKISH